MTKFTTLSFIVFWGFGLSGCAAGSGSEDGSGSEASDPAVGPNGLVYGSAGQQLTEAEGVPVTMQAAVFESSSGTSIEETTITLGVGFINAIATEQDATVRIFGENVTITNGEGALENGQTVRIIFDADLAGTYSGAISVISYGSQEPGITDALDGESHLVFGFETDPDVIGSLAPITGLTTYSGDFSAAGLVLDGTGAMVGDPGTELQGSITIYVDFNNSRANGVIEGSYQTGGNDVVVTLNMGFANYAGSGFTGILTCPDCVANSSSLDATFYGPNAEELGGVVSIDATSDVGGENLEYIGAGSFIITP